jgi:manganese/iron transport system ATP-binding protein
MTTHDIAAAVHECSRLCLLNGRVIADGAAAQLPVDAWMRAFDVRAGNPMLRVVAAASEVPHALAG